MNATLKNIPTTHLSHTIFCHSLEASGSATARTGWQPQHLLAETADGAIARRRALLSEIAFARRIRVRPRLGRGLRARRRRLLSQAPGVGAVHAGDRPAPAGAPRRPTPTRCATALAAGLIELCRSARGLVGPCHLPAEAGMRRCSARTASCSAPTSSSTGRTTATPPSTISSPRSPSRKRKTIRRERARRARHRHHRALADRQAT